MMGFLIIFNYDQSTIDEKEFPLTWYKSRHKLHPMSLSTVDPSKQIRRWQLLKQLRKESLPNITFAFEKQLRNFRAWYV